MGTRIARIGFVAFALSVGLGLGVGVWDDHLLARLRAGSYRDVELELKLAQAAFLALELVGVAALIAIARLPSSLRVRRLAIASVVCAGVAMVGGFAERWMFEWRASGFDIVRVVGPALMLIYGAADVLLAVVGMRVARAARSEWVRGVAIAALASRVVVTALAVVPVGLSWSHWIYRACQLLIVVMCAGLASVVTTIEPDAPASRLPVDGERLSAEWRAPADGVALYLWAGGGRVLCALFGWLVMFSARGATSTYQLRDTRSGVLLVAALSAVAALTMLAALWRISRAPVAARASGPALSALGMAAAGLVLDAWSTSITVDALGGDISAAFFAMKALPVMAALGALLGVGTAVALLRAIANLAKALTRADLAARADSAAMLVVGAGVLMAIAAMLMKGAGEAMLAFALLAVPLAIAALVQFVRAAVGVERAIRQRS